MFLFLSRVDVVVVVVVSNRTPEMVTVLVSEGEAVGGIQWSEIC